MKHIYCAPSGRTRSGSRLGQPTSELSTAQYPLVIVRGERPSHGSRPQSNASDSCSSSNFNYADGGELPGTVLVFFGSFGSRTFMESSSF